MKGIVLLTAAVTPDPALSVAVSSASTRLEQYKMAIAKWQKMAEQHSFRVVVVETSGFDPDQLRRSISELGTESLIVNYRPTEIIRSRGKGAIEAAAMEYALAQTPEFAAPSSVVYKSTGRLSVRNFASIVEPIHLDAIRVRRTLDRRYCDTRFFATTLHIWTRALAGMADEIDDSAGRFLENVLAKRLIDIEYAGAGTVERFPVRPAIEGTSGTSGSRYGSLRSRLIRPLIQVVEGRPLQRFANKQS